LPTDAPCAETYPDECGSQTDADFSSTPAAPPPTSENAAYSAGITRSTPISPEEGLRSEAKGLLRGVSSS